MAYQKPKGRQDYSTDAEFLSARGLVFDPIDTTDIAMSADREAILGHRKWSSGGWGIISIGDGDDLFLRIVEPFSGVKSSMMTALSYDSDADYITDSELALLANVGDVKEDGEPLWRVSSSTAI